MLQLPRCGHGLRPCGPSCHICFLAGSCQTTAQGGGCSAGLSEGPGASSGLGREVTLPLQPQCPQLFVHELRKSEKLAPESISVSSLVTWRGSGWRAHVLHGPLPPTASLAGISNNLLITDLIALSRCLRPRAIGPKQASSCDLTLIYYNSLRFGNKAWVN